MPHSPFATKLRSLAGLATSALALLQLGGLSVTNAFDITKNTNLAVYWGQNSYGGSPHSNESFWQKPLEQYCNDDTVDMFPIAFLNMFNTTGGLPMINLANSCPGSYFDGTSLLDCSFMASHIKACQDKGKAITLSLGGATCAPDLKDDAAGKAFAQIIWDLFLGGKSDTRPFGDAVLDGIDMDIEAGTQTGFVAFLTTLRSLMDASDKQYYITAAPQCFLPEPWIGNTLNHFGFDAVFVQFYNNWCGLQNYSTSAWNFAQWDDWAKNISPNKNVKVYIGAPAAQEAASYGYVDASRLATVLKETQAKYSSFGGAMLWDMSQAYVNDHFDVAVKKALVGAFEEASVSAGSDLCASLSPWRSNVVYLGGDKVAYDGRLWTAKWWSYNDLPRGAVDVWADEGSCDSETGTMTSLIAQVEEEVQSFIESYFENYFRFRVMNAH